ncbi:MAG TPA: GAF domain-containing protein [Chthonomonas sp.]|jgi:GAF domain-containing protein|uniref:GAF domain-containing protein n=1 Tax=Chthonomonas sp. TaxID=2282153 RepID=UPI002B4B7A45|nr:GAF domain-containing protein [Chthonomonas sp.]HLH79279.1 GAF domain-containing protein [Chthonomonas sp.]
MSRAASQRAAIRRLHAMLAASLPKDTVYQAVVEEACRLTDAAGAALCFLAEDNTLLDYVAAAGEYADQITGLRVRVTDSLAERVLHEGRPVLFDPHQAVQVGDLFEEEGHPLPATFSPTSLFNARTAALVPVYYNNRIVGVLAALNRQENDTLLARPALDEEDIDILETLAGIVSLAQSVADTNYLAREHSRELNVFYDAIRSISSSLNLQEVVDKVLDIACRHMEHHAAALFLLNDEHTHLIIAAERNLSQEESERQLSVENSLVSQVLHQARSFLIADVEEQPDFEDISDPPRALSALIVPIRNGEEVHGLIMLTSLQRHAYNPDDLRLLTALGLHAGIAIENAELYEEALRQATEASALYEFSQQINSTLEIQEILDYVADCVCNLLEVDRLTIRLYDRDKELLIPRLIRHPNPALIENLRLRPGEGIAGWVFEWQTPQAVVDVAADPRNRLAPIHHLGIASVLCVPMHAQDQTVGVIEAMSSKRRLFTVAEMERLYTIANQSAAAILNATLYQEARAKSHEMRRYFKRVSQAVGTLLEQQDLPLRLADLCVEMLRADRCTIYRLSADRLSLLAASRFRTGVHPEAEMQLGQGLAGWVAKRGQSLIVPLLLEDDRAQSYAWLQRDHMASYLGVPVKVDKQVVGVVEVYSSEPDRFDKEEAKLLTAFLNRTTLGEKLWQGMTEALST